MTSVADDLGGASAVVADLGGAVAPLVADLQDGSQSTVLQDGSDDLSLDQAAAAPVVAGVLTLSAARSDTYRVTVTADITTVALTGWPSGAARRVAIYFVQDDVGGHVVTWPSSYKWSNGLANALSTAPGAIDCFVFTSFDGGQTVFGNVVGLAYA